MRRGGNWLRRNRHGGDWFAVVCYRASRGALRGVAIPRRGLSCSISCRPPVWPTIRLLAVRLAIISARRLALDDPRWRHVVVAHDRRPEIVELFLANVYFEGTGLTAIMRLVGTIAAVC